MTTLNIHINDWHDIHAGFDLVLHSGYTPLVGPNGAGKTTLLSQLREYAHDHDIMVFEYSNLQDGGDSARQKYILGNDLAMLAAAAFSSEGEQIALNFSQAVSQIGGAVKKAKAEQRTLFILLDSLDSGASIDRLRELRSFFGLVHRDIGDSPIYLVVAVNAYELVKDARCIDVRSGCERSFGSYGAYAEFICRYFDEHQPPEKKENAEALKAGRARMKQR